MADPDVVLKGILERNTVPEGEVTEYRLNDVSIEVDLSEVGAIDESLEGMPLNVEGHFETRDHPEVGERWIFKAHSASAGAFSDSGGTSSTPPPGV